MWRLGWQEGREEVLDFFAWLYAVQKNSLNKQWDG
jgi:hypothetical protein